MLLKSMDGAEGVTQPIVTALNAAVDKSRSGKRRRAKQREHRCFHSLPETIC
jgi:hypothetical protein